MSGLFWQIRRSIPAISVPSASIGLLALLLGCQTPSTSTPTPAPKAGPTPVAPSATPTAKTSTGITVWTRDNIQQLTPVAPARKDSVAKPIPANPKYDEAIQIFSKIVDRYGGDPENPWAVAHGLLAKHTDFKLTDGREAIPALFAMYAEPKELGGLKFVGFPKSRGNIRVEPHTDLLLKNMQEAGVAVDASFPLNDSFPAGSTVKMADLYRYTLMKTYLVADKNHSSFEAPNDIPWGLQALATWAPAGELQWVAYDGTPMDLDYLTDFLVAVMTQESAFLFESMQKGQSFSRSGQPLFGYTCGGAHLVQGASYAVARGYGGATTRKAVEAQVPLWFYRMPIELAQLEDVRAKNKQYATKLWVQQVKFLGHFLETVSKMQILGLYKPTPEQEKSVVQAADKLVEAIFALQNGGALDQMETIRKSDEQLYLDIIGDSAHAIRGLELALGRGTLAW